MTQFSVSSPQFSVIRLLNMSEDSNKKPIVVKRIKKVVGGAHGGAWKIAYADFVTAMMAFFLLMWLLGSTTSGDLKGISDYFKTPLKVALRGGSGSGDSSSVIKGGGQDLTRSFGQVRKGDLPADNKVINLKAAQQEILRIERKKIKELKENIEQVIGSSPSLYKFKNQILLDITSEGLRIQIVDEQNRPMFRIGRAELEPYTKEILHEIGKTLNEVPNKISLSGHTDAAPYSGGSKGYSNWELSADRANASRRELIAGGMAEDKIIRVVGLASAVLYKKDDPLSPINRRISIIVMNKKTEEAAQFDGGRIGEDVEISNEETVEPKQGEEAAPSISPLSNSPTR